MAAIVAAGSLYRRFSGRGASSDAGLVFWQASPPLSSDPLDADDLQNSILVSTVYSGLATKGRRGAYLGALAETWEASPDFRRWRFVLRKGMRFGTGAEIRPCDVVASWRRVSAEMRRRGSESGFFERLVGGGAPDPAGGVRGMSCDGSTLTLEFRKPFPRLLDAISDELYLVVSPNAYDPLTGAWKDKRSVIPSGAYALSRWTDAEVVLDLRPEFLASLRHPRAARRVTLAYRPDRKAAADIVYGLSIDGLADAHRVFHGSMDSGVLFGRCLSWSLPGSPCADARSRRALRDSFYEALQARGFRPERSFFPTSIPGIREFASTPAGAADGGGRALTVRPLSATNPLLAAVRDAAAAGAARAGYAYREASAPSDRVYRELTPGLRSYEHDVTFFMTEITLDDPEFSVRFMFRSKEGIRLPDPSGRAAPLLDRSPIDLQAVNEVLWQDAIVWPIGHQGFGTWVRPGFDYSLVNEGSAVTPIQWIGVGE